MVISIPAKNTWKDPLTVPRIDRLHILERSVTLFESKPLLLQNEKIGKEFYLIVSVIARLAKNERNVRSVSFTIVLRNNSLVERSLTRWFLWKLWYFHLELCDESLLFMQLFTFFFLLNISDRICVDSTRRNIEKSCSSTIGRFACKWEIIRLRNFSFNSGHTVAKGYVDSFRASAVSMTLRRHMKRNNGKSKLLVEIYFIRS